MPVKCKEGFSKLSVNWDWTEKLNVKWDFIKTVIDM